MMCGKAFPLAELLLPAVENTFQKCCTAVFKTKLFDSVPPDVNITSEIKRIIPAIIWK